MSSRDYGQACAVANFFDRMGSRWTLLIIRDLLIGPRRFKDLLDGLPGIGTNLLATRLRELQENDIIEKAKEVTSNAAVYVLTEKGLALEPVVLAAASWGMRYLRADYQDKFNRPDLLVVAFRAAFQPQPAMDVHESYEMRIGNTIFYARIDNGLLQTGLGTADQPAFVYITDADSFDRIVSGDLDEKDARKRSLLEIIGDQNAYQRFLRIFNAPTEARP